MVKVHSFQLLLCRSTVLIFFKNDRESGLEAWGSSIVDNELPRKVVQGGPEVIGNLTYPYRVVNRQFRYVIANNNWDLLLYFENKSAALIFAKHRDVVFEALQAFTRPANLGIYPFHV